MISDQTFDGLVTGFYRAACEEIGWSEALGGVRRAFACFGVDMHAIDVSRGELVFSYADTVAPPECLLDYVRTYHRIDPRASYALAREPGEWLNCWEKFDDAFVASDPFYQEFLIPYGGRYVSGTKLWQDGPVGVVWGVHRGHRSERLDAGEIAACQRLGTHLGQALKVAQVHKKARQEGWLGMEMLANVRAPAVLLDRERLLLHANAPAKRWLGVSKVLIERQGRLHCRNPRDDKALLGAFQKLLPSDGTNTAGAERVIVRAGSSAPAQPELSLHLHALHPPATLRAFGDQPRVLLLIHEHGQRVELDPFVLASGFDLTPGEARVAVAVAHGESLHDIAAAHGVSINTVRTQLKAVFSKTGVGRQSELVSLLARLPGAAEV